MNYFLFCKIYCLLIFYSFYYVLSVAILNTYFIVINSAILLRLSLTFFHIQNILVIVFLKKQILKTDKTNAGLFLFFHLQHSFSNIQLDHPPCRIGQTRSRLFIVSRHCRIKQSCPSTVYRTRMNAEDRKT